MRMIDDFVNSSISALRFIALPLRRTVSTPHDTRFARLDLGLVTKSSMIDILKNPVCEQTCFRSLPLLLTLGTFFFPQPLNREPLNLDSQHEAASAKRC